MSQQFENLEVRTMMAGGTSVPLVIEGTNSHDTIVVTQAGNTLNINLNGVVTQARVQPVYLPMTPTSGQWLPGTSKIVIYGRDGYDNIDMSNVAVKGEIYGGAGWDTVKGGTKDDLLFGPEKRVNGSTNHYSEAQADSITGGSGNDTIDAAMNSYNSALNGGAGNDTIRGGIYADQIVGGVGDDFIVGNAGDDNINASTDQISYVLSDNDTVDGGGGYDTISGGVGNDDLMGGPGNDSLLGESGNDTLRGGDGNDRMYGGVGNDSMYGANGNDSMWGDAGNDLLQGHANDDYIAAGDGNDTVQGGMGNDHMQAGDGLDEVNYVDHIQGVRVELNGNSNNGQAGEADFVSAAFDIVRGGNGNDVLIGNVWSQKFYGGSGHDRIDGKEGNDTIYGEQGNDWLQGGVGNDTVFGNEGNDQLYGGRHADQLFAGAGNDTLVSIGGGNNDSVWGEGGTDSFWIDTANTEYLDVTVAEANDGRMHRVSAFSNSASIELEGQNLFDPFTTSDAPFWNNFAGRPLFGQTGPQLEDVRQGQLGTCYFLAGLGATASKGPGWIHERVADLGDGTYAVMYGGSYIRVDADLPVASAGSNTPAFARFGLEGCMWVPIMEKAFALYRNPVLRSYDSISGGFCTEAFSAMGISNDTFWDGDNDDLLVGMYNALVSGDAVTASTISGTFVDGMQIVPSHCYTVVNVNLANKTIRLRNPWGTDAGNSAMSWNDGNNDGFVTLTINQFRSWFDDTAIANI